MTQKEAYDTISRIQNIFTHIQEPETITKLVKEWDEAVTVLNKVE